MTQSLESIETNPQGPVTASVIWLHGLGADGGDFANIVPELKLPQNHGVRFIFPHAPYRAVTINNGYVMRAWYDILDNSFSGNEDSTGIQDSANSISMLVQKEIDRGTASNRILLAGFSQGGAIVLHAGLRFPQPLAGILALSTYLPLAQTVNNERHDSNSNIPIFMAHGRDDPIIPLALAESSCSALKTLGYPVEWHRYPMEHSVCPEEIADISGWMTNLLF